MKREKRAKLYFRLMDITLALALVGFLDFLVDNVAGIQLFDEDNLLYNLLGLLIFLMNFFMPVFLVLARFMRDEYAQLLWQRSIAMLVYIIAVVPAFIWAGAWISHVIDPAGKPNALYAYLYGSEEPFNVIVVTWMVSMLLFVAIFQYLRWRDVR